MSISSKDSILIFHALLIPTRHGSRFVCTTLWNYPEQLVDVESPCFVTHGSRSAKRTCSSSVWCSSSRCSSASPSVGFKVCVRNGKCVYGLIHVSYTHLLYLYQWLTEMCVLCVLCVGFSEFILGLLKNTVLFSKKNFNSNYSTHITHISTAPVFTHFIPSQTLHTLPCSVHTSGK